MAYPLVCRKTGRAPHLLKDASKDGPFDSRTDLVAVIELDNSCDSEEADTSLHDDAACP